jgi:ubiquinone/menaquinone biosynthesis C-methylase UbiE
MLARVLEPELMDTAEDAAQYDSMDHASVNTVFVSDLLTATGAWGRAPASPQRSALRILDLGAGTAQIPTELARRSPNVHITALDAAESMLALARANIAEANITDRIDVVLADAKQLPFDDGAFDVVISNSILHHIPEPRDVIRQAIRVTAAGGLLFHRDLARPNDETQLQHIVATYASDANAYQQKLFADSLWAALTAREMADLVADFGFARDTVRMTSDRHWTWTARKL